MQVKFSSKMDVKYIRQTFEQMRKVGVEEIHVGVVGPQAQEMSGNGRITNAVNAIYQELGTSDGHVPARHFLRDALSDKQVTLSGMLRTMLLRALNGEPSITAAEWFGKSAAEIVRDFILNSEVRPLDADSTREKKGPLPALVDSMSLVDAITYKVVRASADGTMHGDTLDAGADSESYESYEAT